MSTVSRTGNAKRSTVPIVVNRARHYSLASPAMATSKTVLVIGTGDTKAPELECLRETIEAKGGRAMIMDVGVMGVPSFRPVISNDEVALAADSSIAELIAMDNENDSMSAMARGAARIARRLFDDGEIDAMLALGGTMGTDLAFDVALALPLGVPKVVVSSVAFSHLIPESSEAVAGLAVAVE